MRASPTERIVSLLVGLIGVAATRAMSPPAFAPPAAPVPPIFVRTPVPIPMATPRPVPVMLPAVVAVVPPRLDGCATPALPEEDMPIGRPATAVELADSGSDEQTAMRVASWATGPTIAMIDPGGAVRISVDSGADWHRAFRGHSASSIAVDDRGRVYVAGEGGLGFLDERDHERWTAIECQHETCTDRVVAIPGGVAHIHDATIRTSHDGGVHWRALDADAAGEIARLDRVFSWNDTLYGVSHVEEMCGWHADQVAAIELRTGRERMTSFDDDPPNPGIDIIEDAGSTWLYAAHGVTSNTAARDLLIAKLSPTIGGRTLIADHGELIELCGVRGRVVSHFYGADRVDAVDGRGQPILVRNNLVLRWSPRFHWRVIYEPAEPPEPEGSD